MSDECERCGADLGEGADWSLCGPCASYGKREQMDINAYRLERGAL